MNRKETKVSNEYISTFCMEMALLLHGGIQIGDGLQLLAEDETDKGSKELLSNLAKMVEDGKTVSDALRESGSFPKYMIDMTEAGETSGRQEQAFQSLSEYYEGYCRLINQIKAAVLYPVILTCLMLIILVVLLVKVLPVFNKVYEQLGGQMNGIAGGLLQLGVILGKALPVLGILFAVCLIGILFFSVNAKAGRYIKLKYKMYFGDQGIGKKIGTARFAAAMSMGMMSGLVVEDAFRLAAVFQNDVPRAKKRYDACIQKLEEGMGLAQAVRETKILDSGYCRMLELGIRSGSGDVVIQEIARRLEEETEQKIQEKVNRIEPTIVITASIMVGIILISVMLPLINIMSSIG